VFEGRLARMLSLSFALAICGWLPGALAQSLDAANPLFASDEPLQLTIEGPFREIARMNRKRPNFAGRLTYDEADGPKVALDLKLRIRGNSRLEVCRFPPLRLDLVRRQLDGTVFAGQNRLKLATLCQQQAKYRDYLGIEYSIYRMFNALSDHSFRVRWASVEYITTDYSRGEPFTEPAFFIEAESEVAARHGMEVVELDRLGLEQLDQRQMALLGLFQYVIGNTDWAGLQGPPNEPCCHNGKVIRSPDDKLFLLPYDFDQSGLVDAEYAQPNAALPIRSVRQRMYRGYCYVNAEIDWAVARLNERRPGLERALLEGPMSQGARDKALAYLSASFEIINDPGRRDKEIVGQCRK
jgi:hypothetical protein